MHKTTRLLALIALSAIAANALAERTPARFGTGEDSLPSKIEFPELKGDTTVTLRCASLAEENGKLEMNGCYVENPADQLFSAAVIDGADHARVQPAVADGKEQRVYLQYRVEFTKKGEEETVNVYPNPGVQENIDAYGQAHVAAQRVVGKEKWQDICPENVAYVLWLKAHVAPDGTASNFSLAHSSGLNPPPRCHQAILDTVSSSLFFPALSDGEPVPSTYVEPFGN
ncbi:MAG TPA: hypothetical protein VE175_07780 [Woeseiaceae bacterium]|jgi:hypothetical protein|nr:hypothetical protein [Woeseiaceae bacterium]